jgi:hypothetical protein
VTAAQPAQKASACPGFENNEAFRILIWLLLSFR